jgi:hypothetical protein
MTRYLPDTDALIDFSKRFPAACRHAGTLRSCDSSCKPGTRVSELCCFSLPKKYLVCRTILGFS